jgi:hypothetical protein
MRSVAERLMSGLPSERAVLLAGMIERGKADPCEIVAQVGVPDYLAQEIARQINFSSPDPAALQGMGWGVCGGEFIQNFVDALNERKAAA